MTSPRISEPTPPAWFEEYSVGMEFVSPVCALSDDDVRAYVRFSNDVRPLLATGGPGSDGPLRVPNMFLFSLSVGLLLHGSHGYIPERFVAFFGFDTISFVAPAYCGDRIHSLARVVSAEERGRNGVVTYEHQAHQQDGSVLVRSTQRILVERRDSRG